MTVIRLLAGVNPHLSVAEEIIGPGEEPETDLEGGVGGGGNGSVSMKGQAGAQLL